MLYKFFDQPYLMNLHKQIAYTGFYQDLCFMGLWEHTCARKILYKLCMSQKCVCIIVVRQPAPL